MRAQVITIVVVVIRKVATAAAASFLRIVTGAPSNEFEREMTDMLRRWTNKIYERWPVMNGRY